jgi:predicted pyridoxine 5'-phosphate oxidase superfamily flavin-nucleotide-binding protein
VTLPRPCVFGCPVTGQAFDLDADDGARHHRQDAVEVGPAGLSGQFLVQVVPRADLDPDPPRMQTLWVLTDDMREIVGATRLCFVATVCADGSPNLSPKGSLRVFDEEHLIFMDIASPGTIENLRHDPRLEINAIDVFRRRGYRFKGTAELLPPGHPAYESLRAWLIELNGPGYPANQAVLVHVEHALPVLSPAYTFGHADEAELSRAWRAIYAGDVRPRPPTS